MNHDRMTGCRALAGGVIAVAALLWIPVAAAFAAPSAPAHAASAAADSADHRVVQDLARSILSQLPASVARHGGCEPQTLDPLRAAVSEAIAKTDPSRDVALAALALARQQASPTDACVLVALDDTADELDGSGATVDDAGKVRGFVLYTGPLPPFITRVSNP
jgi:hypothetical protein